jgi:hypothetical protein
MRGEMAAAHSAAAISNYRAQVATCGSDELCAWLIQPRQACAQTRENSMLFFSHQKN